MDCLIKQYLFSHSIRIGAEINSCRSQKLNPAQKGSKSGSAKLGQVLFPLAYLTSAAGLEGKSVVAATADEDSAITTNGNVLANGSDHDVSGNLSASALVAGGILGRVSNVHEIHEP